MSNFMTFHTHMALALQLIALVAGLFLVSKACAGEFFCKKTGKILGGFVVIVSLLSTVCILYLSINTCYQKNRHMHQMGPMMEKGAWQHPPVDMPAEEKPDKGK